MRAILLLPLLGALCAPLPRPDLPNDRDGMGAAILRWRFAQIIDPQNAATANSLGGAFLRAGRAADAAKEFERAIALANDVAAYRYNLANVEFMLRRDLAAAWKVNEGVVLHRALEQFRCASALAPNDPAYAQGYAEAFYIVPNANWAEAEAAWKHFLEISPHRDFAYLQLVRVSLKRGDKSQALAFLNCMNPQEDDALRRKLRDEALVRQ